MKAFTYCRIAALAALVFFFSGGHLHAQHNPTLVIENLPEASPAEYAAFAAMVKAPTKPDAANLTLPPPPAACATFYDDAHKDLAHSLAWLQETNAIAPTYWNLYTESRIRLKMKDYPGARTAAEKAYQLALKAMPASQEYVMLSAGVVAKAHELAAH